MQNNYSWSKNKFLGLSPVKQTKIVSDIFNDIQKNWMNLTQRTELIGKAHILLNYLAEKSDENNDLNIDDLKQILNSTNWLDYLQINKFLQHKFHDLKDHEMITVMKDDSIPETRIINPINFILYNLRSSFNVGSIFRTADCLGVEKIYLCGYTPTPENIKLKTTAMGTEKYVPWEYHSTIEAVFEILKDTSIYALETVAESKTIYETAFSKPCALILGNEALGIPEEVLIRADSIVNIPVYGWKNSLNVGVTTAICGYEILRQWGDWERNKH